MAYDQSNKAHQQIHKIIQDSGERVFVFMKGTPDEPACRFSGTVAAVLEAYGVKYDAFNVLEDDNIREAIKSYSDWPTIPQVFIDKSFVGGCDIILQMHQSGDLSSTLGVKLKPASGS